jgi:hypothetical protein
MIMILLHWMESLPRIIGELLAFQVPEDAENKASLVK